MRRFIAAIAVAALTGCASKQPTTADVSAPVSEAPRGIDAQLMAIEDVGERIDAVAERLRSGDAALLPQLIAVLEQSEADDTSGLASLNLGVAYWMHGRLDDAESRFSAVTAAHPGLVEAWLYLGAARTSAGDHAGAATIYASGIEANHDAMSLRAARISALRLSGRPDVAVAEAKDALAVNALEVGVYNAFAVAYMDMGDTTLARFVLQKAIQTIDDASENAELRTHLGWTYFMDGDVATAEVALKEAVALDGDMVPALVGLASVYLDDRNFEDARPLLTRAAELDPNNAAVRLNYGLALRGVGDLDAAESEYRRAWELDPNEPAPLFNLGVLLGDYRKDYGAAIKVFDDYVDEGGSEAALAEQYVQDLRKEKKRSDKRKKAEQERAEREAELKRKKELLEAAEQEAPVSQPTDAPSSDQDGTPPELGDREGEEAS